MEDPKRDHLPWQQHVLVFLVMREIEEKNEQQTDPRSEEKKQKAT